MTMKTNETPKLKRPAQCSDLLGTVWRHKKKGGIYRVTQTDNKDNVYLQAETKGCRSTWKYNGLLTWDYEQVPNEEALRSVPTADVERKGK